MQTVCIPFFDSFGKWARSNEGFMTLPGMGSAVKIVLHSLQIDFHDKFSLSWMLRDF